MDTTPALPDPDPLDEVTAAPPSPRSMTLSISLLVSAVLLAVLALLPAPYAVSSPGPTRDTLGTSDDTPLISITGAPTYESTGELRLTTVSATGGPGYPTSLVGVLRGYVDQYSAVRPVEDLFPPDATKEETDERNEAQMVSSQENATVAALRELGYEVGESLRVHEAVEGSGSDGVLQSDDVLLALDGTPLTGFADLASRLAATEPGTTVTLTVQRGDQQLDLPVVTTERDGGGAALGISVDPQFTLPVVDPESGQPIEVTIKIDDIGGSSAGTMFALGIIDKLTPQDEANGQVVAGTGTISTDGQVGPIGGIQQKLPGARRDGADWFLAPAANCDEVVGHVPEGLRVVRIETLHDAREALVAIGKGAGDTLPTCTAADATAG